jgi:tetratricopeptide (TPR) repeat protein
MTPDQTRLLIDHLDESLRGKATASLEDIIGNDPEAEKEWNYLRLTVDAVKDAGLYQEVTAVRAAWKAEFEASAHNTAVLRTMPATDTNAADTDNAAADVTEDRVTTTNGARVRTLNRYMLRVAACILIVSGSASIYKYVTTSSASLYDRYYSSYDLNTSRGAGDADPMVEAYKAKDWTTVEKIGDSAKASRTNQTDFLSGMACLEKKRYDKAITHFEQIIAVNNHNGTDYYQDEAEFYLAVSWLAQQKINEAMPILEKIRADKRHKYNAAVDRMSFFDLRLAQYKENK